MRNFVFDSTHFLQQFEVRNKRSGNKIYVFPKKTFVMEENNGQYKFYDHEYKRTLILSKDVYSLKAINTEQYIIEDNSLQLDFGVMLKIFGGFVIFLLVASLFSFHYMNKKMFSESSSSNSRSHNTFRYSFHVYSGRNGNHEFHQYRYQSFHPPPSIRDEDYYSALELKKGASQKEIRDQYHKLAMK
jgi:hypothetical protein